MSSADPRLERFRTALAGDGFEGTIVTPGDGSSPEALLVAITDDAGANRWQLEIAFVPGIEDQLDGNGLAQFFVAVSDDVPDGNVHALREAVVKLNTQLPIVGFGCLSEPSRAIFRSVLMTPPDLETASALALQTAWMVSYLLSLYGDVVSEVALRGTPFADAIAGHPHAGLFV